MTTDAIIGLTGTIVSSVSLVVSVWFYFSHINRSLEKLLQKRLPMLSEDQALDLSELYLSSVQSDLQRSGRDFVEFKFPKCIEEGNDAEAHNTVYGITDSTIQRHRSHLKRFCIVGGQSYEQFLNNVNPIDSGIVAQAKQKVFALFRDAITNKVAPAVLNANLVRLTEAAYRQSKVELRAQIQERYRTVAG